MNDNFICPICKVLLIDLQCPVCRASYRGEPVAGFLRREMYSSEQEYATAMRIIDFWGHGWKKRLKEDEHRFIFELDPDALRDHGDRSLAVHIANRTLMGVEVVAAPDLAGKLALNIGCGSGDEALCLTRRGARCIAMDITPPAAEAAQTLMRRAGGEGVGIQADARFIPLADASVDVVYSSGVIHHSPDIQRSISEIHRVLKPGGTAFIMLYATWSIIFMQEKLMRWTGEKAWETPGRTNPLTTTYSKAQCRRMFGEFGDVRIRKAGASLQRIAKIGRYLPTKFDRFIDGPLGATLNIVATKTLT